MPLFASLRKTSMDGAHKATLPHNSTIEEHEDHPVGKVIDGRNEFAIALDCSPYGKEEVIVGNTFGEIIVEGRHHGKTDEHGKNDRHFIRRYSIPEDAIPSDVTWGLNTDGLLTVSMPRIHDNGEREAKIEKNE